MERVKDGWGFNEGALQLKKYLPNTRELLLLLLLLMFYL